MTGAIFYELECSAPWGFRVPAMSSVAASLAPGTEKLVSYHLLTEGEAVVTLGDGELRAVAGDLVVLPHGDAHMVTGGQPSVIVESKPPLGEAAGGQPELVSLGGGGALTRIVCGFFGCRRHAERLFLAGLPPIFKISLRDDRAGAWLESSVRHLAGEARSGRAGSAVLLSKMAEALFVETLRRYMEALPAEQGGWLAGARDPLVGAALALLHRFPERGWTADELATEVGASRSVLHERFARFLGDSPLAYLGRWRLQLAARALESTSRSVLEIAAAVGYQSEAAFSRAFKRELGVPPSQYRKQCRATATAK